MQAGGNFGGRVNYFFYNNFFNRCSRRPLHCLQIQRCCVWSSDRKFMPPTGGQRVLHWAQTLPSVGVTGVSFFVDLVMAGLR